MRFHPDGIVAGQERCDVEVAGAAAGHDSRYHALVLIEGNHFGIGHGRAGGVSKRALNSARLSERGRDAQRDQAHQSKGPETVHGFSFTETRRYWMNSIALRRVALEGNG